MVERERIYGVIPAAGQGSRMGVGKANKQFLELQGIPVLIRTLLAFEQSPRIDGIAVVANPSDRVCIQALCEQYRITKLIGIAAGGETRQDSVRNALEFLSDYLGGKNLPGSDKKDYVLIHDGARPFVSNAIIERCIDGAIRYHACGAGVPVKDTIKQVRPDGTIFHTPPREELWAIQTPQAFLLSLIEPLHRKAFREGLSFTDDTAIAEHYGEKVHMVTGGYQNIKITTPEDLLYGEVLLRNLAIEPF